MQVRRSHEPSAKLGLQERGPFNPYRRFTGIFIPESLVRCRWLSAGAKLAWGRLARHAGHDGPCYPTMKILGREIGIGERQVQKLEQKRAAVNKLEATVLRKTATTEPVSVVEPVLMKQTQ